MHWTAVDVCWLQLSLGHFHILAIGIDITYTRFGVTLHGGAEARESEGILICPNWAACFLSALPVGNV